MMLQYEIEPSRKLRNNLINYA